MPVAVPDMNSFTADRDARLPGAQRALADSVALAVMLPWLLEHLHFTEQQLGPDYWSTGFAKNKTMLETIIRYMRDDGLTTTLFAPEDLFADPGLLAT